MTTQTQTQTRTAHLPSLTFPAPGVGKLAFDDPTKFDLTVPSGSPWATGRHWHNGYTEYWKMISGGMLISINNDSYVLTEATPMLSLPPKTRHEIMRWDCPGRTGHQKAAQEAFKKDMMAKGLSKELEKLGKQDLRAAQLLNPEEPTKPGDGEKEVFFRNMLSTLSEPRTDILGEVLRLIQIVVIYKNLDAQMVVVDMRPESGNGWRGMVEEILWWLVASMASLVGAVFDLKPVNEAYTPDSLLARFEKSTPR